MIEASLRAAGPYSLRLSTRRDEFRTPLPGGGEGWARQRRDRSLLLRAPDEAGLELLRFVLALDTDTTEFVLRFRRDPLLGPTVMAMPGFRPTRTPTVAQAVLRAFCGQLVQSRVARQLERAIVRRCGEPAPTREALGKLAPAELRRLGLAQQRASSFVRICRSLDLERLRSRPVAAVAERLLRERGIGPYSLGVIALDGLGSYRYALTGDLSFVKLMSALEGRWVEPHETAALFEPYGEWAGLASAFLLRGWKAGIVPGADADRARAVRLAARHAA